MNTCGESAIVGENDIPGSSRYREVSATTVHNRLSNLSTITTCEQLEKNTERSSGITDCKTRTVLFPSDPREDTIDAAILARVPIQSVVPLSKSGNNIVNSNVQRYSRSTLYLLRNDARSKRRPECVLRTELMTLGVWKVLSGNGSFQQNGNGSEAVVVASGNNSGNSNSTSTTHVSSRGQRSPSTRNSLSSTEHTSSTHYVHPNQKSYIDHRSISSAHLMPAFAKRRIGVPTQVAGSYGGSGSGGSAGCSSHASGGRPETPTDGNQSNKDFVRQRGKEHIHERQRTEEHSSTTYLSPQRKNLGDYCDRERQDRTEGNHSGSASPAQSSLSNARHNHSGSGNERRIGSGRLLHCDANWDYRSSTDKDNIRNVSSTDKDSSSHHQQQRNSSRFTDRGGEHRTSYVERRTFDRRSNDLDSRDKFENRNSNIHTGSRRFLSIDMENNSHAAQATEQHPVQHTRTRRHHYNERNDEPEWFSGGPTSQNDTIELRGFDEMDEHYGSTNKNTRRKLSESSSRASSNLNLSNSKSKDTQRPKEFEDKEKESNSDSSVTLNENKLTDSTNNANQQTQLLSRSDKNNNDGQLLLGMNESVNANKEQKGDNTNDTRTSNSISSALTEFNFDAFLNMDPLNHSLMGADMKPDNDLELIRNSRFSRWFVNESNRPESRNQARGNLLDENKQNDMRDMKRKDADRLCSPILNESHNIRQSNTLMQFLQGSPLPSALSDGVMQPHVIGIPSVEELEARMRKTRSIDIVPDGSKSDENSANNLVSIKMAENVKALAQNADPAPSVQLSSVPTTPQDTEAFKKLLEQLGSANKHEQSQLNIVLQQQKHQQDQQLIQNSASALNLLQPGIVSGGLPHLVSKNEEFTKFVQQQQLLHQQQRQVQQCAPHPLQHTQNEQPLQVLQSQMQPAFTGQKRVEAQNLLQSLSRGEVKIGFLEQELNNPNTRPYAKEIIAAVIREHTRSGTPSSSVLNVPSHPGGQAHALKLLSPTPIGSGGNKASVQQQGVTNTQMPNTTLLPLQSQPVAQQQGSAGLPSPRDLQFHTQTIMQNAIIKKKLEEQEVFRRRPEMQKHQPLSNAMMPGTQHALEMEISQKTIHQHQLQAPTGLTFQQQSPQASNQQQHQTLSSHPSIPHQQRHINSPTPLAFTPTSVLRKMTAEKDNSTAVGNTQQQQTANQIQTSSSLPPQRQQLHHPMANKNMQSLINQQQQQQIMQQQSHQQPQVLNSNVATQAQTLQQQPRMILGGGSHPQQQQQMQLCNGSQQITTQQLSLPQQQQHNSGIHTSQQKLRNNQQLKWPPVTPLLNQQPISVNKPIGRPILKGPLPTTQTQQKQQQLQQHQQQLPPMTFASKIEFQQIQQQQKLKINPALQHIQQQQQQFSQSQTNIMTHVQQQLFQQQQQQRAVALQRAQHIQLQQLQQQQHHQQQPPQQLSRSSGLIGSNQLQQQPIANNVPSGNGVGIINYQRDGGLSPTSNQLAQWFSPELLAQASAGKLPLLNMNQALSLEEFERSIQHSSTAVHN